MAMEDLKQTLNRRTEALARKDVELEAQRDQTLERHVLAEIDPMLVLKDISAFVCGMSPAPVSNA